MSELIPIGIHKKKDNGNGNGLPWTTVNFEFTGSKLFNFSQAVTKIILVKVDNIPLNGAVGAPLQYRLNSPFQLEILDEMIVGEDFWVSVTFNYGTIDVDTPDPIAIPTFDSIYKGAIVPTSTAPSGTGVATWSATQAGTYTNFGGVVVAANSLATISRNAAGVFSISQTALDLTAYVTTTNLGVTSKDIIWLGSLNINTTTNVATSPSAFLLSKNATQLVTLGNTSFSFTFSAGMYYVIWIDIVTKQFSYSLYNSATIQGKNILILCRVYMPPTGGILQIHENICVNLVLDGLDLGLANNFAMPKLITELIKRNSFSANDAFWTTSLTINTTTGKAQLAGGYILSRTSNTQYTPTIAEIDVSFTAGNFYVFWFDTASITFGYSAYNAYQSIDNKDKFILCRFRTPTPTTFILHKINVANLTLNGVNYGLEIQENLSARIIALEATVIPPVVSEKYVQIGDSISWQFDGKKENFRTEYPTETGYLNLGGYGQKITKIFGITYANHASHGLNGHTFAEFMAAINNPPNANLVYALPKDGGIYTIKLGTNDFGKSEPLGTKLDYLNNTLNYSNYNATKTIYGALRKLIDYITDTSTSTKDKKIIFITPIGFGSYKGYSIGITSTWEIGANGEIVEKVNAAGVKMSDIVTAIKWVANQIGASVIDLYGNQGLVQKNRLNIQGDMTGANPTVYQGVLNDNLHPSGKGQKWLGNYITDEMKKIISLDSF